MADYTLAIGTHDPHPLVADGDQDAVRQAVGLTIGQYAEDLRHNPQEVATLLGPSGPLTRPSERIDEFVKRLSGLGTAGGSGEVQPGDTNAPDCNGD